MKKIHRISLCSIHNTGNSSTSCYKQRTLIFMIKLFEDGRWWCCLSKLLQYMSVEFSISLKIFTNSGAPYVFVLVVTMNAGFTLEFMHGHFNKSFHINLVSRNICVKIISYGACFTKLKCFEYYSYKTLITRKFSKLWYSHWKKVH